jgi:hypothetical protein
MTHACLEQAKCSRWEVWENSSQCFSSCLISALHLSVLDVSEMVWGANLTFIFAAAHGGGFLCQQWWLVIGLSLPLIKAECRPSCCWSLEVFVTSCHAQWVLMSCIHTSHNHFRVFTVYSCDQSNNSFHVHINWSWAVPSIYVTYFPTYQSVTS